MISAYLKLAAAAQQTALDSMVTINQRMWRFASGDPAALGESMLMIAEKQSAFFQASIAFQREMARSLMAVQTPNGLAKSVATTTHATLKPFEKTARSNARRLSCRR